MGNLERRRHVESQDEEGSKYRSWAPTLLWCAFGYLSVIATFLGICFSRPSLFQLGLLPVLLRGGSPTPYFAFSPNPGPFKKPQGVDIIALVPFHHHERTGILECYLQVRIPICLR